MRVLVRNAPALLLLFAGIALSVPVGPGHEPPATDTPAYSAADPPELRITLRDDDLHLRSHTVSSVHERQLADIARRGFMSTTLEFLPLGVAPRQWYPATLGLLEATQAMLAADVEASGNFVAITGVIDRSSDRGQLLAGLPASLVVDSTFITADSSLSAAALCEREFGEFDPGDIRFDESGTALRTSANPALDRVVALADACRGSRVVITGHTDASGDETANRALSLARARAVADIIAARGIDRARLVARGAGSSRPRADNGTRYGRSLNRRIEVAFEPVD